MTSPGCGDPKAEAAGCLAAVSISSLVYWLQCCIPEASEISKEKNRFLERGRAYHRYPRLRLPMNCWDPILHGRVSYATERGEANATLPNEWRRGQSREHPQLGPKNSPRLSFWTSFFFGAGYLGQQDAARCSAWMGVRNGGRCSPMIADLLPTGAAMDHRSAHARRRIVWQMCETLAVRANRLFDAKERYRQLRVRCEKMSMEWTGWGKWEEMRFRFVAWGF